MGTFYITSISGWLLIVLLIVTIAYPYLLRRGILGPVQPFLKRMRLHYWLGYSIAGILLFHTWIPMSARLAGRVNQVGLDLATGALFLVFAQVALGFNLSQPKLSIRRMMRRWHFAVMVGIVALVLGHIALDGGTFQMLFIRS
jgi:hypothetical protein